MVKINWSKNYKSRIKNKKIENQGKNLKYHYLT